MSLDEPIQGKTTDKLVAFEDKKIRRTFHNGEWYFSIILETAVGPRQKVQDFESESLTIGVEHSQKGLVHL